MDATLKKIADAYAAAQDALPAMMNSGARDHWLGLVREFAAAVLEAVSPEVLDVAGRPPCTFMEEYAAQIRS